MTKFFSICWLVPMIVALTFGSIIGVTATGLIILLFSKFLDVTVPDWILILVALLVTVFATVYQRRRTIPRLSKGDLTGTVCNGLALAGLVLGMIQVECFHAPGFVPAIWMAAGYIYGGILHVKFRPCNWQPRSDL